MALTTYVVVCVKILEMNPEDEAEEDGANVDLDSQRKGKCVVLKTSTRQVSVLDDHYLIEFGLHFYFK